MNRIPLKFLAVLLFFAVLPACTTNPATGKSSFTGLMSLEGEKSVGAEGYRNITSKPGSIYENRKLQQFVQEIGERLARHSERTDINYTFTVLNTEDVNAFAMPGGYIFITRGLLAVANSEAEVAGVLAHEMAHITARHSAQQYSKSVVTGLAASIIGAVAKNDIAGQLAGTGGELYLKSYSREHEHEADALGLKYMEAEGYDPFAMSKFLSTLLESTKLQAKLAGADEAVADRFDYFATHPTTQSRIAEVEALARAVVRERQPYMTGVDRYMNAIDGTVYGSSQDEGIVKGRDFIHVPMDFRFTVPAGFDIKNGETKVVAQSKADKSAVIFDIDTVSPALPPEQYISSVWMKNAPWKTVEYVDFNGKPGAMGYAEVDSDEGMKALWATVIRFKSNQAARFLFMSDLNRGGDMGDKFRQTAFSFRSLTPAERQSARPFEIRIVTAGAGDTPNSMVNRMRVDKMKMEHFLVINGLGSPSVKFKPGQKVKVITD